MKLFSMSSKIWSKNGLLFEGDGKQVRPILKATD